MFLYMSWVQCEHVTRGKAATLYDGHQYLPLDLIHQFPTHGECMGNYRKWRIDNDILNGPGSLTMYCYEI